MKSILIYQDAGTFEQSALAIKGQLQRMFGQTAEIRMVDSHFLRTAAWRGHLCLSDGRRHVLHMGTDASEEEGMQNLQLCL